MYSTYISIVYLREQTVLPLASSHRYIPIQLLRLDRLRIYVHKFSPFPAYSTGFTEGLPGLGLASTWSEL